MTGSLKATITCVSNNNTDTYCTRYEIISNISPEQFVVDFSTSLWHVSIMIIIVLFVVNVLVSLFKKLF